MCKEVEIKTRLIFTSNICNVEMYHTNLLVSRKHTEIYNLAKQGYIVF